MMSQSTGKSLEVQVPNIINDRVNKRSYSKGVFLGKGGFARVYEVTDLQTKLVYAGKIVAKTLLQKQSQREKMKMEIEIHRNLSHQHVVKFYSFFEDDDFVYIILELCKRKSLMELHKRRKAVTEPEARYYLLQILTAIKYIHSEKVIHRDLKLGNLFLNDTMDVKIGDFGLASKIDFDGERKKTLCGTPNYIAPEVLTKKGHSYEVDVWAVGCILYTLLVGNPPFETSSLKETYLKIRNNDYRLPQRLNRTARSLLSRLLSDNPADRPNVDMILNDEFFQSGFCPKTLPISCLTTAPRFNDVQSQSYEPRKVLSQMTITNNVKVTPSSAHAIKPNINEFPKKNIPPVSDDPLENFVSPETHLKDIQKMLNNVLCSFGDEFAEQLSEDSESPQLIPIYWISKWVDYSDKYGLGYQLCDGSVGVLFNDNTRLILFDDDSSLQFIDREMAESFFTLDRFDPNLKKKVTLLKYFRTYMTEHLLKAGAYIKRREADNYMRLPFLRTWFRTRSAIVMFLNNGTLQLNFFECHTKLIFCPIMGAVSFIDEKKIFRTFKISDLKASNSTKLLYSRLRYAQSMVEKLLNAKI